MDSAQITLSPSVAEAISLGAVVEQLRDDAFRDDDDASRGDAGAGRRPAP